MKSLFEFGHPEIDFEKTSPEILKDYLYVLTTHAKKLGQKGLTMLEKLLVHNPSLTLHAFEQDPIASTNIIPVHYALTQAIKSESAQAVKLVLDLGDKEAVNKAEITKNGPQTPLHCSISTKQSEIVSYRIT